MAKSIFEHQSATVPENQTVNDVVVIGGDATILGTVSSSVIVFNGDAYIRSTGHIKGLVLVVGGKVQQESGAEIANDIIAISLDNATQNSLLIGGGLVLGIWAIQLIGTLIMLLIPALIIAIGNRRVSPFIERYDPTSFGRLLYTGFLSGLILVALSLLLLLTVVGIPLLLVIALIVLVSFAAGLTAVSSHLGNQIRGLAHRADWVKVIAGASIVTAAVNIPLIGMIILLAIVLLSLGITTQWIVEKTKKKKTKEKK